MVQQINLYVRELRQPPQRLGALATLTLAGATALGCAVAAVALQRQADAHTQRNLALQQSTALLQAQVAARAAASPSTRTSAQEIQRLHQQAAGQRKVQAALDAGTAAAGAALPSEFLLALARQSHPSLWITGFVVSADERTLEIRGRMLDASALPDYLRRLNAEALFKGRSFAQLDIRSPEPPAGAGPSAATPYAEFVLRSLPGARQAPEAPR